MTDQPTPGRKDVFAGIPDVRQQNSTTAPTSRFRPTYRALSPRELAHHDEIKGKASELEALIVATPNVRAGLNPNDQQAAIAPPGVGRYVSLALTDLENSVMWAVKGLTS